MSTITVITPVHTPAARYLSDAWASLRDQVLPDGWRFEWMIVEDGKSRAVPKHIPNDPRITFFQNRSGGGPGIARNLALGMTDGDVVKSLDADDMLLPGAIARDIAALETPGVDWVASSVLDLLPDGSTSVWDMDDPPPGRIERGAMLPFWEAHGRPPVVPGCVAIRRQLIESVGGWMALPAAEDTGMLLTASMLADGWFEPEPGYLYRKWPGQTTAGDNNDTKAARHELIRRRIEAMQGRVVMTL